MGLTSWSKLTASAATESTRRARLRISLRMRAAARIIAVPALIIMIGALFVFWRDTWPFPVGVGATEWTIASTTTIPVSELFSTEDFLAPNWWMSVSILALIALPAVNVTLVLWENLRTRRWLDVAAALGVLAILLFGALSGH